MATFIFIYVSVLQKCSTSYINMEDQSSGYSPSFFGFVSSKGFLIFDELRHRNVAFYERTKLMATVMNR